MSFGPECNTDSIPVLYFIVESLARFLCALSPYVVFQEILGQQLQVQVGLEFCAKCAV